ncbi:hypothetical protein [Rhodococcus opacus]|uniref:hypothetical protein n=1 Tax=Rhodococcus opacus TaxID=37919 RepID=UPI001C4524C5|nr:hypothetical protein [Rhodococcus opacus]MBV6762643.1 hypothetical protein [Rhodococcus opacus]
MNTRNTFRSTTALAMGILTATAITAACGTENTDTPAITTTAQPALNGPEGSQKAPEQQASEAAIAKVNEFFAVLARVESDPTIDINTLDTVASGTILDQVKANVTLRRSQGIVSTGALNVVDATVTAVDAPIGEDGTPTSGSARADLRVCVDGSDYQQRRPDGSSTLDPNRIPRELGKPTLENVNWPDASGWRVISDSVNKSGTACDAP